MRPQQSSLQPPPQRRSRYLGVLRVAWLLGAVLPSLAGAAPEDRLVPSGERLEPAQLAGLRSLHLRHPGVLAFSHTGKELAADTGDGRVCIWDLTAEASGPPARCFDARSGASVQALAWSPRDVWLAAGHADGQVTAYPTKDLPQAAPPCVMAAPKDQMLGRAVSALAFVQRTGTLFAAADRTNLLRSCDGAYESDAGPHRPATDRERIRPPLLGLPSALANSVTMTSDAALLVAAATDGVAAWEVENGQRLWSHARTASLPVALAATTRGRRLAIAYLAQATEIWDAQSGTHLRTLHRPSRPATPPLGEHRLAFSPDGRWLAEASSALPVAIFQADSGRLLRELPAATTGASAIAFDALDEVLATVLADSSIVLWDVISGRMLRTLRGNVSSVRAVAWSPRGNLLAAASEDRGLRLWRRSGVQPGPPSWDLFCKVDLDPSEQVQSLAFAPPEGSELALVLEHRRTLLLDVERCPATRRPEVPASPDWQKALAFSADGARLAIGADDGSIRVWDLAERRLLATLRGHRDEVRALAFSPTDKSRLASGSLDKTVRLWRVDDSRGLAISPEQLEGVRALAFTSDGRWLATATGKAVAHWQVTESGTLSRLPDRAPSEPSPSAAAILHLDFRDDGRLLTMLADGRLQLSEPKTGQLLDELRVSPEPNPRETGRGEALLSAVAWYAGDGSLAVAGRGWIEVLEGIGAGTKVNPQQRIKLLAARDAWAILHPEGQLFRHDPGTLLWQHSSTFSMSALAPPLPLAAASLELRPLPGDWSTPFGQPERVRLAVHNHADAGPAYWLRIDATPLSAGSTDGWRYVLLPSATQMRLDPGAQVSFDLDVLLRRREGGPVLPARSMRLCLSLRQVHESQPAQPCHDASDPRSLRLEIPVGPWWWRHIDTLALALLSLLFLAWQLSWSGVARRLRRHPVVRAVRQGRNALAGLRLPELAEAEQVLRQAETTFALRHIRRRALRLTALSEPAWRRAQGALGSPASLAQALADCVQAQLGATTEPQFQNEELCAYGLELPALSLHLPSRCTLIVCNTQKSQTTASDTQIPAGGQSAEAVLLRCPREPLQRIHFALVIDLSFQTDLARFAQGRAALKSLCPGVPFVFLDEAALRRILFTSQVTAAQGALREPIVAQCEPSTIVSYQEGGGIPPDDEGLFFGRQAELERMLGRQRQNFLLVGPRKMGKSSLLNALARELGRRVPEAQVLRYEPLFGRLQGIESRDAALSAETPEQFYESVLRRCEAHQIFLLDETDDFIAEESRSQYRYCKVMRALSGQGRATFVLAGYQELLEATQSGDHPLFNFGEVLRLEPLDREAARRMIVEPISALGIRFAEPQQTVDWLRDQTACRPHLLALLCAALVKLRSPLSTSPIPHNEVQMICQTRELLQTAFGSWSGEAVSAIDRVVLRAALLLDRPQPIEVIDSLSQQGVVLTEEAIKASLSRLYSRHYALIVDGSGRLLCPVPLFRYFLTKPPPARDGSPTQATGESSLQAQLAADIQALKKAAQSGV